MPTKMVLQLALFLVIFSLAVCAVALPVMMLFQKCRPHLSRLMDRKQVRPSIIPAVIQTFAGASAIWLVFFLPSAVMPIGLLLGTICSINLASGIDAILNPPAKEYRPRWYVGEGAPNWLPTPTEMTLPRFSLTWIAVFISTMCVTLAGASASRQRDIAAATRQEEITNLVESLGGRVQQETVTLAGTSVTDEELLQLANLPYLSELNLGNTAITNDGLKYIGKLTQLQRLNLSGTEIDDEGLAHLARLNRLMELNLRGTKATGAAIPLNVADTPPNVILNLSLCPVTRKGLLQIARMKHLLHVDLSQTDVDRSMLDALKTINARSMNLGRTKITSDDYKELCRDDPNMQIIWP